MIKNLYVLDSVKDYVKTEIRMIEDVKQPSIRKKERKLSLQKNTPWGKFAYSDATICAILGGTEFLMMRVAGMAVFVSAGYIFLYSFGAIDPSLRQITIDNIKRVIDYAKIPLSLSAPFFVTKGVRSVIESIIEDKASKINSEKRQLNKEKQVCQDTLFAIEDAKNNPEIKTILNDVLNNVELSKNGEMFNLNLIKLLSTATIEPSSKNLKSVANYIRNVYNYEPSSKEYDASAEFLENELVQKIMKKY